MNLFWIIIIMICVIDFLFYINAPYPERARFLYRLPFGGILAYFKFK